MPRAPAWLCRSCWTRTRFTRSCSCSTPARSRRSRARTRRTTSRSASTVSTSDDRRAGTLRRVPSKIFQAGLLDEQVAVVSGGGSGLGRAAALELASLGARVVVCGRRQEPLDETVELDPEGRVEAQACDIREEEQVEALVEGVCER